MSTLPHRAAFRAPPLSHYSISTAASRVDTSVDVSAREIVSRAGRCDGM
jgi:hypothetical protein